MNIPAWAKEWTEKGWEYREEGTGDAYFSSLRRSTRDGHSLRIYEDGCVGVNVGQPTYRELVPYGSIHRAISKAIEYAANHGGWKEPGSCPGSPAADLQADQLIASNQKDDLSELPTPREGYQWVKVEVGVKGEPNAVHQGDMVYIGDRWEEFSDDPLDLSDTYTLGVAIGKGWTARQVPTPEPEGPEVIWGPRMNDVLNFRILADGTLERQERGKWLVCGPAKTAGVSIAADYASLYAKDQANTALLDSFYELGERAEKWFTWFLDDKQGYQVEPGCYSSIIADLAKAYKEAKGDAKQDV